MPQAENNPRPTRRHALAASLAAAAGGMALGAGLQLAAAGDARRALRVAHLTDMHVQPELRAGEGYAAALDSLERLDPPPAFIMTGGDASDGRLVALDLGGTASPSAAAMARPTAAAVGSPTPAAATPQPRMPSSGSALQVIGGAAVSARMDASADPR